MSVDEFKRRLAERLADAKRHGVPDNVVKEGLVNLADLAVHFEDPTTEEERLMRELWDVAGEKERHTLAGLLVRLAEKEAGSSL